MDTPRRYRPLRPSRHRWSETAGTNGHLPPDTVVFFRRNQWSLSAGLLKNHQMVIGAARSSDSAVRMLVWGCSRHGRPRTNGRGWSGCCRRRVARRAEWVTLRSWSRAWMARGTVSSTSGCRCSGRSGPVGQPVSQIRIGVDMAMPTIGSAPWRNRRSVASTVAPDVELSMALMPPRGRQPRSSRESAPRHIRLSALRPTATAGLLPRDRSRVSRLAGPFRQPPRRSSLAFRKPSRHAVPAPSEKPTSGSELDRSRADMDSPERPQSDRLVS